MSTVTDPTNEWYTTSQQSALIARPRQGCVLHHGATTDMDAIIDMETSGSKQVSSNRVAKDKRLAKIVDDGMRAWSLSSAYYDSILWSCECANESTDGWTISAESQETLAQWVAYLAQKEGWVPNRSGDPSTWTVFGHREIYMYFGASYPTACPGAMDLDWITARAIQILTTTPKRKKSTMTTNFVDVSTYKNGVADVGTQCATGGDSPGTPANWIEYKRTMKPGERAALYSQDFGPHIPLTHDEFIAMKADYLSPLAIADSGGGTPGKAPTATENAKAVKLALAPDFDAIPTAAENGTAARAAIVKP